MADPGLQPERTVLSWGRTGWASLAVSALLLRAGWLGSSVAFCCLSLLLAAYGAWILVGGRRRAETFGGDGPGPPPAQAVLTVAAMSTIAAAAGGLAWFIF